MICDTFTGSNDDVDSNDNVIKLDRFGRIIRSRDDRNKYDSDGSVSSSCSSSSRDYYWIEGPKPGRRVHSIPREIQTTQVDNAKSTKRKKQKLRPNFKFKHNYVDFDNIQPSIDEFSCFFAFWYPCACRLSGIVSLHLMFDFFLALHVFIRPLISMV